MSTTIGIIIGVVLCAAHVVNKLVREWRGHPMKEDPPSYINPFHPFDDYFRRW